MPGLDAERTVTREEAAEYLREFADKLAGDGRGFEDRSTTGRNAVTEESGTRTATDAASEESGATTAADENRTTNTATGGATEEPGRDRTEASETHGSESYGKVTFLVGNDSATVNPPAEVALSVEVGEDSSMMSSGAETVTFSLHWDKEAVPESDELRIE